jgi:hypothetical protein
MHIERLIDDYDIWHQVSGHRAKTREWYRWILRTFTRWLTTGRSPLVADITIGDARAFLQAEATRTVLCPAHPTGVERPGRLSDRTLQGYARALRVFRVARSRGVPRRQPDAQTQTSTGRGTPQGRAGGA